MAGRKKNPINDIIDTAGAWLGGSKGRVTNPQVQAAMDATRAIGKVVDTATGGFGQAVVSDAQRMAASGSSTPSALYKTAAVNLGAAAAGVGAAKIAGKAVEKVSTAYKTAKTTAVPSRTVLYHGGPRELKGGVIDPSFVRGDVASTRMAGNTAALNQRSLDLIPMHISQYKNNIDIVTNALTDPASYSSRNRTQALADIKKMQSRISHLESWGAKAQQENYFTAVQSADQTYAHEGAIHIVSPKRENMTTLLGPGNEYQVVGKEKPVASFSTGGRPGQEMDAAMRLAQQTGDKLKKKLQRQAVAKQTLRNLAPKRK